MDRVSSARLRRASRRAGLTVIVLVIFSGQSRAATFDAVMETMMQAQGAEGTLLGRLFGADPTNAIQFNSSVDVPAGSFQFQAAPGSTYRGEPLQLLVTGSVDDQTSLWTINSQGAVGTTSWIGNGAGIVAAPDDPDHGEVDWSWGVGGIIFDFHLKWDWHLLESFWLSTMEAKFTINNVVVATGEGADALGDFEWDWKVVGTSNFHTPVESHGNAAFPNGGPGSFEMRVIPEPSTGLLALCGCVALLPMFVRGRFRRAPVSRSSGSNS